MEDNYSDHSVQNTSELDEVAHEVGQLCDNQNNNHKVEAYKCLDDADEKDSDYLEQAANNQDNSSQMKGVLMIFHRQTLQVGC